jgi:hypothetical protein
MSLAAPPGFHVGSVTNLERGPSRVRRPVRLSDPAVHEQHGVTHLRYDALR